MLKLTTDKQINTFIQLGPDTKMSIRAQSRVWVEPLTFHKSAGRLPLKKTLIGQWGWHPIWFHIFLYISKIHVELWPTIN